MSRFSEIYINNQRNNKSTRDEFEILYNKKYNKLTKYLNMYKIDKYCTNDIENIDKLCYKKILELSYFLYENSYTSNMIVHYIDSNIEDNFNKYKFILVYNKYKKEFRNEVILLFIVLNYYYFRINIETENILNI